MYSGAKPALGLSHADDAAITSETRGDARLGTLAGNYRLVARLGEGGMAAVYRGEHRDITGAVVAVKLLDRRWSATPGTTRRFLREAQAMFELMGRNRHIPRVLDYGRTESGENYMVMEYLRGRDLAKVLQEDGPLPWPRVAEIALQLCEALAAAHARDILHRDIKPANCFLVEENGVELVKLIDFGIAKDLRVVADPTAVGTIVGTPAYLAPEILIDGARPSVRSDIYSLGATLYRLLTDKLHVAGQTWQDIAYHLQRTPVRPPSAHLDPNQPLPPAVDALVLRALNRDPGQRFASVLELADAVRRCLPTTGGRRRGAAPGRATGLRRIFALGVTPLLTLGALAIGDPPASKRANDVPASAAFQPEETLGAVHAGVALPAGQEADDDAPHVAHELEVSPPDDAGNSGRRATKPDANQRRRALRRELGSMRRSVEVCATRHGGNLVAELAVRVQVGANGVGERVTLPEPSSAALVACVTSVIQSRRYTSGPAAQALRHVFRFDQE